MLLFQSLDTDKGSPLTRQEPPMPTARAAHAHSKSRPCPHQEPPKPTPRATHAHSKSPMPPSGAAHAHTMSRPCPLTLPGSLQKLQFQDLKHWHGLMNCADTLLLIDVNRRLSEVSMVSPKIEPLNYQLSNRGVRAKVFGFTLQWRCCCQTCSTNLTPERWPTAAWRRHSGQLMGGRVVGVGVGRDGWVVWGGGGRPLCTVTTTVFCIQTCSRDSHIVLHQVVTVVGVGGGGGAKGSLIIAINYDKVLKRWRPTCRLADTATVICLPQRLYYTCHICAVCHRHCIIHISVLYATDIAVYISVMYATDIVLYISVLYATLYCTYLCCMPGHGIVHICAVCHRHCIVHICAACHSTPLHSNETALIR